MPTTTLQRLHAGTLTMDSPITEVPHIKRWFGDRTKQLLHIPDPSVRDFVNYFQDKTPEQTVKILALVAQNERANQCAEDAKHGVYLIELVNKQTLDAMLSLLFYARYHWLKEYGSLPIDTELLLHYRRYEYHRAEASKRCMCLGPLGCQQNPDCIWQEQCIPRDNAAAAGFVAPPHYKNQQMKTSRIEDNRTGEYVSGWLKPYSAKSNIFPQAIKSEILNIMAGC